MGCKYCGFPHSAFDPCDEAREAITREDLERGRGAAYWKGKAMHESKAFTDVAAERRRQVESEGFTKDHDDEHHVTEELAVAAACYALNATWLKHIGQRELVDKYWPWDVKWWKPKTPREDLVRAAALILAEIERLDRAEASRG